jgi:hypothetical protein
MPRRGRRAELPVRSAFEPTRVAPSCLAGAYERVVPIPRRLPRQTLGRGLAGGVAAAPPFEWRRAERG